MVVRELAAVSGVANELACVMTRRTRPVAGRPAIICCHGRGQNHYAYTPALAVSAPVQKLVEDGWVAVSLDNAGTTSWGNDNAIQTVTDALAYCVATFGCANRALLFAMSMGALPALSWAARNASKVAAVAASYPVTDLAAAHANATFTAEIEAAYGGSAGYAAALAAHSAIAQASSLTGVPIRLYKSTNDATAPPATHVDPFVTAVPQTEVVSLGAVGHGDYTLVPTADVSSFLAAHA